jgi:hypothetical protein
VRPRRRETSGAAFLLVLGFALGLGGLAFAATRPAPVRPLTAGRVPTDARLPDGSADLSAVPDLIAVTDDQQRVVGYAYATDVFKTADSLKAKPRLARGIVEVWDKTGKTLVGHLYPNGAGFVSLEQGAVRGVSPANPPPTRTTPSTVLVRP